MAGQVKDHGVGAFTGLISAGAVALIGELFKNAVSEGVKSGGIAFWLTMIVAALVMIIAYIFSYNYSVIFREYGLDSADADERITMLQTYLALISDGTLNSKDDLRLVLSAIFRPGNTGLLEEQGSFQTPIEFVLKRATQGNSAGGSGQS